eukprot:gene31062-7156_t
MAPSLTELDLLLQEDETVLGSTTIMRLGASHSLLQQLRSLRLELQVSPSLRAWDTVAYHLGGLASLALHMPLSYALLGRLSALTSLTALEFTAAGRGRRGEGTELKASLSLLSRLTSLKRLKADGPCWPSFGQGISIGLGGMSSLDCLELPGREGVTLPDFLLTQLKSLNMYSLGNASPVELSALTHLACSVDTMFDCGNKLQAIERAHAP